MPGIPLVARETTSRSTDQMCRQDARFNLTPEEEAAAEESLSIYCKPVELYNILQRRAIRKPLYLQRCLGYKIQAKHKKRIQLILSLLPSVNHGLKIQSLLPLYIMLARPAPNLLIAEQSARYQIRKYFTINPCPDGEGTSRVQAKFILPEYNKLSAEIKSGSLSILFISFDEPVGDHMDFESFQTKGGNCRLGKILMELLHLSWEESPNLSLGERSETILTVDLHPCVLKTNCLDGDRYLSFQATPFGATLAPLQQLKVIFHAEEVGAKDRSAYDSYTYSDVPSFSLPHLTRLRTGNVVFSYRYYNNKLQRTEVTEDFSCPFCLVKCSSFKGLRFHLSSSHDLFNFEFWATEDYQAVNVSVRTDTRRSEIVAEGIDPKQQTFFFCSKPQKRRKTMSMFPSAKHVHPLVFESDFPMTGTDRIDGSNTATPTLLQFAKTRKLSTEHDHRNRSLLQKQQFFHSHRAQPMALEQVMSDQDSEDEVDDDVADLEDRRMLDDFVDVANDEKQIMHLWNSLVRKQRVLADGHTPWACEAFTELHAFDLVRSPALLWCWRLFMVKLWNHGLLDQLTLNKCSIIINEQRHNQSLIIHSLKPASNGVESPLPVRFDHE